jgi:hypothetical protein
MVEAGAVGVSRFIENMQVIDFSTSRNAEYCKLGPTGTYLGTWAFRRFTLGKVFKRRKRGNLRPARLDDPTSDGKAAALDKYLGYVE